MVRRFLFLVALATALTGGVIATVFGSVRGVVHDPQHRPMSGAHVTLQANNSAYKQEADTNADGVFEFQVVPLGQYTVTVQAPGFVDQSQTLLVVSGSAPVLHYAMALASTAEKVTVTASPEDWEIQIFFAADDTGRGDQRIGDDGAFAAAAEALSRARSVLEPESARSESDNGRID